MGPKEPGPGADLQAATTQRRKEATRPKRGDLDQQARGTGEVLLSSAPAAGPSCRNRSSCCFFEATNPS